MAVHRVYRLLSMLVRENLLPGRLTRTPEQSLVMDTDGSVAAWHTLGADDGPIAPLYHLNALASSRLVAHGGTVVDLGCGSGRYAAHLARLRPDLRVVGIDLSLPMVETGNAALEREGLAGRVQLRRGDIADFESQLPRETSLITCLLALHHLPTLLVVERCLEGVRRARDRQGCGFLLFDLARPRHVRTTTDYPLAFTPDAPEAFKQDSVSSLVAAYSHAELKEVVSRVLGASTVRSVVSRLLPLYQAFWAGPVEGRPTSVPTNDSEVRLAAPAARSQLRALRTVMPGLPA